MAYGMDGFVAVSKQNSWGVATSNWHYIPIVSESIATEFNMLQQESILARYDEPAARKGLEVVEGDINMEFNPIDSGPVLLGSLGQITTTSVLSGYVYKHVFDAVQTRFDSNAALQPYTIQINKGVGDSFQYTDGQFNTLEIGISAEKFIKFNSKLICRTSSLMTATTASYYTTESWTWDQASFSIGGYGIDDYEEFNVNLNNNLEGIVTLNGTKRRAKIQRNGYREIKISGTIGLPNLDEYNEFVNQTTRRLLIYLQGSQISSGYNEFFEIDIAQFHYEAFPINIGGPGRITVGFSGRARYNPASNYAIRMTLQNNIASY